ncbi:MAG: hypothetical protein R2940_09480 [Syntrophotaleaceae bacterium]
MKITMVTSVVMLTAIMILLQACNSFKSSGIKPLEIDYFYTTSYSGEVKRKYESLTKPEIYGEEVAVQNAPPHVTKFYPGEKVCIAVHSAPGEPYVYRGDLLPPEDKVVRGYVRPMIAGTRTYAYPGGYTELSFPGLSVGRAGGWWVSCVQLRPSMETPAGQQAGGYYHPEFYLKPGQYTVKATIHESNIKRSYWPIKLSFSVEERKGLGWKPEKK